MSKAFRLRFLFIAVVFVTILDGPIPVWADKVKPIDYKSQSNEEIAKELSNPTTPLANLSNVFEVFTFKGDQPGADNQTSLTYSFQPSIPFPLENGKLLFFRPLIPVLLDEPVFNPGKNGFDRKGVELGDISFDLAYGGTHDQAYGNTDKDIGIFNAFGIFASLPTATDDTVGSQQFRLGPEVVLGLIKKWGVVGFLATHSWDVGGSNDEDFSTTTIEYFYAYGLGGGWQIAAGPTIKADWEADSAHTWTVPVGIGIEKTTLIGNTPWNFALEAHYYVVQPDSFGPEFLFIFTVTPVIINPFMN